MLSVADCRLLAQCICTIEKEDRTTSCGLQPRLELPRPDTSPTGKGEMTTYVYKAFAWKEALKTFSDS